MGATYEGTLKVDETKKPKTFDLLVTAGHAAGTRHLGIYKLDGQSWTICLAASGKRRPEKFATKAGTGLMLETLERARAARKTAKAKPQPKPATGSPAKGADPGPFDSPGGMRSLRAGSRATPSGAAPPLEGEWAMVAAVFNGAVMAENMVKWCRRITRGNTTSVVAGPQVMLKATFTLDDSREPQEIDYVNLEGANARKRQAGIVEMNEGILRICMSAPGKPRPREFASKPGDGRSYTTWRPVKK